MFESIKSIRAYRKKRKMVYKLVRLCENIVEIKSSLEEGEVKDLITEGGSQILSATRILRDKLDE